MSVQTVTLSVVVWTRCGPVCWMVILSVVGKCFAGIVSITWAFNPTPGNWHNHKEGTEVFTVRDALALFLKYGPTNGGTP